MRTDYPKEQPAYGAWLLRAMAHCNHTAATLAEAMCMSNTSVHGWTNRHGERRKPSAQAQILVWRTLTDTWPTDDAGNRVPLPDPAGAETDHSDAAPGLDEILKELRSQRALLERLIALME